MKRALLLPTVLLAACVANEGPVGEAEATITQVPVGVACIQLQVVGSRTVTKNVDVMTGMNATVSLPGLPAGADTFSAVAFGAACGGIGGAVANWASDPVVAAVAAGGVTPVTLAMHAVGGASVGVDFPVDGGVTDAGPAIDLMGAGQVLAPSSINFGSVALMVSSAPQTLTFFNASPMSLVVTDNGFAGGDWFTPSNSCTGAVLAPGSSCQIQVGFRPVALGARASTYHVTTNLGTVSAALSGNGL
jgi:hypothetical protein